MGSLGGIAFLRHLDPVPKLPILVSGVNGFGFEGNRLERRISGHRSWRKQVPAGIRAGSGGLTRNPAVAALAVSALHGRPGDAMGDLLADVFLPHVRFGKNGSRGLAAGCLLLPGFCCKSLFGVANENS
jgi:hypothetical protein